MKKNDGAKLFYLGWTIALITNLIFDLSEVSNMFSAKAIIKISNIAVLLILLLKAVCYDNYTKRRLMVIFTITAITFVIYNNSSDNLAVPIMFLLVAKNVDIKKFFTIDMFIRFLVWGGLFLLSNFGIVYNYQSYINGAYKNAFGWGHPNTCAAVLLLAFIELIYIKGKQIKKGDICFIVIGVLFLYNYCEARTYLISFATIIIWIIIVSRNDKYSLVKNQAIYLSILPLCIFISFICLYLYRINSPIGIELNKLLTGRLEFSNRFINEYGLSFAGQEIITIGSRKAKELGVTSAILDMSYIRIPIKYGLIVLMVYVIAYSKLTIKLVKSNLVFELMFVMFIHLIGIASTVPTRLYSNMTLIFFWVTIRENMNTDSDLIKDTISENGGEEYRRGLQ